MEDGVYQGADATTSQLPNEVTHLQAKRSTECNGTLHNNLVAEEGVKPRIVLGFKGSNLVVGCGGRGQT